jgi:hypothetical protein
MTNPEIHANIVRKIHHNEQEWYIELDRSLNNDQAEIFARKFMDEHSTQDYMTFPYGDVIIIEEIGVE